MKNIFTFLPIILPSMLIACSGGSPQIDQETAQNDQQIWQIEDSIKGLWERTDNVFSDLNYMEISNSMITHYSFNENPWEGEGTCYEVSYESLKRISVNQYLRESLPRHTEFLLNGDELKIVQTDKFDDNYNCIFDEVTETILTKVENISSEDFSLCHIARAEMGITNDEALVSTYDLELGIPYERIIPSCE